MSRALDGWAPWAAAVGTTAAPWAAAVGTWAACSVLYCIMLYYGILHYGILYCSILYHIIGIVCYSIL